jgi:hypothetical protein
MNRAEEMVARLSKRTFLALWSYPNPTGKGGKELCDLLAICDPDVIIISVKEVALGQKKGPEVEWARWHREAIEDSAKQIYGAERWLRGGKNVIRRDGSPGIALPASSSRRIHRLAVALGGKGDVPVYMGDLGKGHIHVLTEESLSTVLGELDTVTDLTEYLRAVEGLLGRCKVMLSSELDLLAMYLTQGRKFPDGQNMMVVGDDIWDGFVKRPEYSAKKKADEESYAWDQILGILCEDTLQGRMEFGADLNEVERAIRVMARENRFGRRILSKGFNEFMEAASQKRIRSRMMRAPSGVVYVLLACPHVTDRQFRKAELQTRCFVARGLNLEAQTVVGIATEQYVRGQGFSFDVVHLHIPEWTAEQQHALEGMQRDLGYFVRPVRTEASEDEYPSGSTS